MSISATPQPVLRASVTAAAVGTSQGDQAPILIDGADTPVTANGLQGYTPMPGDRVLVTQVGQTLEVMQFLSVGSVPSAGTIRQDTPPDVNTTPLETVWYDTSTGANNPNLLVADPDTGVRSWVSLLVDSKAMNVPDVKANTVEKGFVLGGGGKGVLSLGAVAPTIAPQVENYWPSWNTALYSAGSDQTAFFCGIDEYQQDTTKWITAGTGTSVGFIESWRVIDKTTGALVGTSPTSGKNWAQQFYSSGGIANDGVTYWIIGQDNTTSTLDFYIYAIDVTTYSKQGGLRMGTSSTFNGYRPRVVADKVNHRMGMIWVPSSGDLMLRWYKIVSGVISQVGSDITLRSNLGQTDMGGAWFGDAGSGLGASTLWVATNRGGSNDPWPNVMCWSGVTTSAATRQSSYDFKKPNTNSVNALGYDSVSGYFQTITDSGVARKTSKIAAAGTSTALTVRYTFYDGDTSNYPGAVGSGTVIINGTDVSGTASTAHETPYSPTASFTTARRAWLRVTATVHAPDETNLDATKVDRANRIGFYIGAGGGTTWRQVYGTVGQIVVDSFDTLPAAGTPDIHDFTTAQQSLGIFQSAGLRQDGAPKFYVDGAGATSNMDGLIAPGTIVMWVGTVPPPGWYICDGSSKTTAAEPDLFAACGYKFGGSGANFNLPDFRGRFPFGQAGGGTYGKTTIGDAEATASGTSPGGAGDTGRLDHRHSHGAGTNVSLLTNTTATGAANRVANAPTTLWTDSQGINGGNVANHGLLVVNFIIKR